MDFKAAALAAALQATSKSQSQANTPRASPAPTPSASRPPVPHKPRQAEHYRDHSSKLLSPHVTGSNLAKAVAGARLAASQNPTPSPSTSPSRAALHPPPPPPRPSASRGVSPHKPAASNLRPTLRRPESPASSSDSEHKFLRRHPNKHNEGNRKRWRDKLSEDEFKRYAGWWAANRGLYITYPNMPPLETWAVVDAASRPEDEMLNLVVRELWRRSRLPDTALAEIWELVDNRQIGRLTKNEFIVGVWLIDQKLKGRKLPTKVPRSVWESVERFNGAGVKIRVT